MQSSSASTLPQLDGIVHPERFDPNEASGRLIDSEHRGRYWWASRLAGGKQVLDAGCGVGYGVEILASAGANVIGVDIDAGAVEEARRRFGERAETIAQGDLRDMWFDDDSFDLIVCFETIEHMDDAEQALAEFRRVLRPDGLLLVSSPNPDVYPAGNEHHVREYRREELAKAVGEHFSSVTSYRQHTWLASVIEPSANGAVPSTTEQQEACEVRRTSALEADGETFGIIVAGEEQPPQLTGIVVLGSAFEVDWWSEQVTAAEQRASKAARAAETEARKQIDELEGRAREELMAAESRFEEQLAALKSEALKRQQKIENDAGHEAAQATAREAATAKRLRETAAALLDANQELAQIPLLKHRLAELHEEHARLYERYNAIEGSRSWRLTDPLRRLWLVLDRRR